MNTLSIEKQKINFDLLLIFMLSAFVILWNLGTGSICAWDEGLYGGVAGEILKTGNWVDLKWAGSPWSDKPPLYMWATAVFSSGFGLNELSVRLFSALCGIGTVLLTYLLALKLYSRKEAFASSLILLSTWSFLWSSKMGMLDIPMTFFVILSLCLFEYGEKNKLCLFLSPLAFTGAFLVKGMGAMLIPMILGLYMLFSGRIKQLKDPVLLFGILFALFLAAIWPLAAALTYGKQFLKDYFVKHLLTRTTKAVEGHTGDILTYFGVVPNKGRPWAGIGLALIPFFLWRIIWLKEKQHLLPVVWGITVFLLFSLVQTKLHWYVVPLYPALAILTGWVFVKLFKKYTRVLIVLCCLASLFYLSHDKNVFDLDYAPGTKMFAESISNLRGCDDPLYVYKISDPGLQFYLVEEGTHIRDIEKLKNIMGNKRTYVVTNRRELHYLKGIPYYTVLEEDNFVLIRSK